MSDPFETLRNVDQGAPAPLAAAEVRRRGDRMRRRRVAARVVGAACAVAVIGTGGVALGNPWTGSSGPHGPATHSPQPADDGASPSPTSSPSPTQGEAAVVEIPEDFPLAQDYPEPDADATRVDPGKDVDAVDELQACGTTVYPVVDAQDTLGTTFEAPEHFRGRELTTYADEATAREALLGLVNGYRDCPREVRDGPEQEATTTQVRATALGDEGFAAVQTYELHGAPTTGLTQVQAVRVGNALLVSLTFGEGAGAPDAVETHVAKESRALTPVVAAMCVFSETDCAGDGEQANLDAALLAVEDVRRLTRGLRTEWHEAADREDPTLDCQVDWLTSLDAEDMAYREFAGTAPTGTVNTEAAAAVLEFRDARAARFAYDTVVSWIETCRAPLGKRPMTIRHDPVTLRTDQGPATWRVLESPAPEICTECEVGWIDAQGLALVGSRVTLLSIAYTGDLGSGSDTDLSPMSRGIRLVADLAVG